MAPVFSNQLRDEVGTDGGKAVAIAGPPAAAPVPEIQGAAHVSPLAGRTVATGVVTAVAWPATRPGCPAP